MKDKKEPAGQKVGENAAHTGEEQGSEIVSWKKWDWNGS